MVDQDVLLADSRETVAAVIADPLGEARLEQFELQVRPVGGDQLAELGQAQYAIHQHHVLRLGAEALDDETPQFRLHGGLDLDAHDEPQPPLLQQRLELAHQILGLFLHLDVGIADQAEHPLGLQLAAREQVIQEQRHQSFERQEAARRLLRAVGLGARQLPEPGGLGRHGHQGMHLAIVGQALQLQRHAEAEVGDEGERMGRIDGQRGQDREQLAQEHLLQPLALDVGDVAGIQYAQALGGQLGPDLLPQPLLHGHQIGGRCVHPLQLLAGGQAILAEHPDALAHLTFQASHAHHVELVEVVGRDRQEPEPLEQRMVGVVALFQHPFVEGQPRELAVEEAGRRLHQGRLQHQGRGGRGGRAAAGRRAADGGVAHRILGVSITDCCLPKRRAPQV